VTLLIVFAVGVMGATLAMLSATDLKISGNQRVTTQALDVAEAGLNEAIHRLSLANPTNVTIGGWTGNVAIGDRPPYDPNWETRIYLAKMGAVPVAKGSIVNTGTIQDPNQPLLEYSSTNTAEGMLTIRHKIVDRNGDGVKDPNEVVRYDSDQIPPENFSSGYPVEIITVTGAQGQADRMIEAEVTKKKLVARTMAALYIDKAIRFDGNPGICGYDHSINTPMLLDPPNCLGWHESTGHLAGVATTGDEIDAGSNTDILGAPTPTDTSSTNPFYDCHELLGLSKADFDQMLANANNMSVVNPLDGITYLKGDSKVNANIVGNGLIYCTGDLTINGTLAYKGLIFCEGDVKALGTVWVLGSVVVRGKTDFNTSAGNAGILYSSDAISTALGQFMPMILLSWREL
jgi:hypothetical protein